MYTIGQVSQMFGLPISTLRYYDKQGLFPNLERASGIRQFGEEEIKALRVIECLKKTGLEIKDIRQFMDWCLEGPATFPQRKALFERQLESLEAEMLRMQQVMDMLRYKCWYYTQAMALGDEAQVQQMIPDSLPEPIRHAYDNAYDNAQP